jgi:hypothetical protein
VRFWREWREEQALRRRAEGYVATLSREPDPGDVSWLAVLDPARDDDHARWELRYARRVMGLLVAERDALDDRTASAVGRALSASLRFDPRVAADKLAVAEAQLNARLRAYGEALRDRRSASPTGERLGRALLSFIGGPAGDEPGPDVVARAGEILARYLTEGNGSLREAFGAASLPEDLPPSAVAGGAAGQAPR